MVNKEIPVGKLAISHQPASAEVPVFISPEFAQEDEGQPQKEITGKEKPKNRLFPFKEATLRLIPQLYPPIQKGYYGRGSIPSICFALRIPQIVAERNRASRH